MKIIDIVENKINRFPKEYVFTYSDFVDEVEDANTIVQILKRLSTQGKILKLSKGKFYKPRETEFGVLKPPVKQIVKDLLEKDGKVIGYLTGYSIYNSLYLTTQISNTLQIGVNKYRRSIIRGQYKISFILQPNTITKNNTELLQILDAVRFITKIPATTPDEACLRLQQIFKELSPEKQLKLVKLSLKYTNYVRALCGAILEQIGANTELLIKLKQSLQGLTTYKIPISETVLPKKNKWNIV
ncbi:DUF6088 family protein [Bacteroidales bacterium OttesenSCG-928-K03]|nr:DUF6088 family protein [Bacteroidales bacterium OttesenSCG-928-L14]MDL2242234.1 DUF6088 family protein [Bacteroidales bacterium OttesenSCG-928-K03]